MLWVAALYERYANTVLHSAMIIGFALIAWQFAVRAIADRLATTLFAATEEHYLVLLSMISNRGEFRPFMGPVTKRLLLAQATGTPIIGFTLLNLLGEGRGRRDLALH